MELNLVVCFQTKYGKRAEENTPKVLTVIVFDKYLLFSIFICLVFLIKGTYFYNRNFGKDDAFI